MPRKKVCSKSGCNRLVDEEIKYCDIHVDVDKERQKDYDRYQRDQKSKTFYDSPEWRKVRRIVLTRDKGLCQEHFMNNSIKFADVIDHIIPIKIDWLLRLELSNLRSLCYSCHAQKTEEDKKKYGL